MNPLYHGYTKLQELFCDNALAEKGIPQVQLELEGEGLTGQIQTRLEGFFEMLEAG